MQVDPTPGLLYLFPSWLMHAVATQPSAPVPVGPAPSAATQRRSFQTASVESPKRISYGFTAEWRKEFAHADAIETTCQVIETAANDAPSFGH